MFKICTKCGNEKPATNEYFEKRDKNKLRTKCRECTGRKQRIKPNEGYLICSSCKIEKLKNSKNFSKNKARISGFCNLCKICAKQKHNLYYDKHKSKIKEYHKSYYLKNKEAINMKEKQYRLNNGYKIKQKYFLERETKINYQRKRYQENKDKVLNINNKYFKSEKGKELIKIIRQKRKAQKRGVFGNLTRDEWYNCKSYFNNKCAYCGHEKFLTQDHFIPLSSGGEYTISNIIPACINCNSRKRTNNFYTWYIEYEHYNKEREEKILKYLNLI